MPPGPPATPVPLYKQNQHEGGILLLDRALAERLKSQTGEYNPQPGHLIDFMAIF